MGENQKAAIAIIDDILQAIDDEECVALRRAEAELRSLRASLVSEMSVSTPVHPAVDELRLLLNREPAFAAEARRIVARAAIHYLEMEVEYYSKIAAGRELSADEKRFGREALIPMIDGVRALFEPEPHNENRASSGASSGDSICNYRV
jgi:hypothetical protein